MNSDFGHKPQAYRQVALFGSPKPFICRHLQLLVSGYEVRDSRKFDLRAGQEWIVAQKRTSYIPFNLIESGRA
jgi:hypothetical protein